MKSQSICFLLLFYTLCIQSEQYQRPINITIHAETQSGLDQCNTAHQNADHASIQTTLINTAIENTEKEQPVPSEIDLEPTVSLTNYTLRNGLKVCGVYGLAVISTTQPWLLPAYVGWRLTYAALSDTPWFDCATTEEAETLAAQGKKKIPEPIVYPAAHHIYKYMTK